MSETGPVNLNRIIMLIAKLGSLLPGSVPKRDTFASQGESSLHYTCQPPLSLLGSTLSDVSSQIIASNGDNREDAALMTHVPWIGGLKSSKKPAMAERARIIISFMPVPSWYMPAVG